MTLIEKKAKAFDIIKAKKVYPLKLMMYKNNLSFYNMEVSEERRLDEEEFNLLKELLL